MEEGHGVNPSSRKYFEYMRNRDPETGIVPEQERFRQEFLNVV